MNSLLNIPERNLAQLGLIWKKLTQNDQCTGSVRHP